MQPIAHIRTAFPDKFGIPRQSGLVPELEGEIVFCPAYRNPDALRGIEEFSHLWLIWEFSGTDRGGWSPTVRPPRLGGNTRVGVFASRSPFRPNPIGLSCVRLLEVLTDTKDGTVLRVAGADLMDGTAILDIKPYLPYADAHPDASAGFGGRVFDIALEVEISEDLLALIPEKDREAVRAILAQDPRPSYQADPDRVYGMRYKHLEIKFRVEEKTLTVTAVEEV